MAWGGRKIECPTPAPYLLAPDVDWCECSSGGVGSLKATASLCCLEAPHPSGRALPQTGHNLCRDISTDKTKLLILRYFRCGRKPATILPGRIGFARTENCRDEDFTFVKRKK